MTIGLTRRNDATGNDSATVFPYGFKVFAATDLEVKVKQASDGVVTTLTYPTHYSVSGVGVAAGGNVTLVDVDGAWQNASDGTLKTGYSISLVRKVPLTQAADIRNQGGFYANVHEDEFDKLTMIDQQQQDAIDRAVKLDSAYDPASFDMTLPAPSAGLALGWNATEDGLTNLANLSAYSVTPYAETLLDDTTAGEAQTTLGMSTYFKTLLSAATSAAIRALFTPLTTKGDLWGFGTIDQRVAVGSDGHSVVADSTAGSGIAYAPLFTTGDVKLTLKTAADTGWVLMNDTTIGNAASGATGRANADTATLFSLLWTNTADAQCAVSGGRGASAAADYAANKTIALPKALGRALATYGTGSGLTARALALAYGVETHALSIAELATHSHSYTPHAAGANPSAGAASSNAVQAGGTNGATTTGTGSGTAHQNMQPTLFLNTMIKL